MSLRPAQFRVRQGRCYGASRPSLPLTAVIPAEAGIHFQGTRKSNMVSRFRGNDDLMRVLAFVGGSK